MNKLATLILSVALASSAFAGPATYSGKSGKGGKDIAPLAPVGCNCFAPGAAVGVYGAALFNGSGNDAFGGGGILGEFFFTENFGIQGTYGVFATSKEHHEFDAAFIARLPIKSICVAPYVMAGGGYSTNSANRGNYFVGGGIEARIAAAHCLGIFADGAYHFAGNSNDPDYTIVRLGVKFPF